MKWYIWSPPYNSQSGGIMVLHRLAHVMTSMGEDVVMVADSKNPDWVYKCVSHVQYSQAIDTSRESVAIYPEIVIGNPLGCSVVVRWLLNSPGIMGGDGIYEDNDLVYKYCEDYWAPDESKVKGLLTIFDIERTRQFKDLNRVRTGTCHLLRKGTGKKTVHPSTSIGIDAHTPEEMLEDFNDYVTLVSYDHATFISVWAALCGCMSIIVPDGVRSVEQWKAEDLYHGYGRAWGPGEVEWAFRTRHLLLEKIEELERESYEQVKRLIDDCS